MGWQQGRVGPGVAARREIIMLVKDFAYDLPPGLIAQKPLPERDQARLLLLNRQTGLIAHRHFCELSDYLTEKDLLVFNDSKVIPARLLGKKPGGAKLEVFLLRQVAGDQWEVLVRPGRKAGVGTVVEFAAELSCRIVDKTAFGGRVAQFSWSGSFEEQLARLGEVPLPPYIHEKLEDPSRYQTVYAREEGSVAAPTAGLHFTERLLAQIKDKGIKTAFITLHVGLGTFRPVSVQRLEEHVMHSEYYSVGAEAAELANATRKNGGRVVAVGTTAVRVLESAGASGGLRAGSGETNIFIYPGHQFKMVDALVTNFHLPQSSLLMLVSAFCRREFVLAAYQEAIAQGYRFFSFGDAMFVSDSIDGQIPRCP